MRRLHLLTTLPLVAVALAGCGGAGAATPSGHAAATSACPAAWRAGWQRLADRLQAPVYCPRWLPQPLTGVLGKAAPGQTSSTVFAVPRRRYLVSEIWSETSTGEVHVNLAGYLHRTAIPRCEGDAPGTTVACFGGRAGTARAGGIRATLYTVNQGPDQWHLLYAWTADGSLYTVSQHVAEPLSDAQVHADLLRIVGNLVRVEPAR